MGLSFKKLARGVKKIAKKNRGGFTRLVKKVGPGLVMTAVTGGTAAPLIARAASAAKSFGRKVKGLETPKSLVPIIRAAQVRVGRKRTRMPGGAPIPTISAPSVGMMRSTPQAKTSLYAKRKKAAAAAAAPSDVYTRGKNKGKKRRKITAPPSAKQLAARAKFAAMAAARRKAG